MVHYLCIHENYGYLSGALWLALFIFLYQLTTNKLEERRARRLAGQPVQAREA
jgi:hypothetical protein